MTLQDQKTDWGALGAPEDDAAVRLVYEYRTPTAIIRHAIYGPGAHVPLHTLRNLAVVYSAGGPFVDAMRQIKRRVVLYPSGTPRRVDFIDRTNVVAIEIVDPALAAKLCRYTAAVGLIAPLYEAFWLVVTPIFEGRPVTEVDAALGDLVRRLQSHSAVKPPSWMAPALDHLHCHWREVPSAENLSALCGISPEHFCRAFRRFTGTTCQRYAALLRIEHARALLVASLLPINQIADACGFADQSHLTRMFAAYLRTTPSRARRAAQARGSRAGLFLREAADFV